MIAVRKSNERGSFNHGWLDTRHTFSFGEYYDPNFMSFRSLRVMNEDWIAGGTGFGAHPHRDMEIVTYVLEGSLAHRDSLGSGGTLGPGELQRMTAGTGISHSEYNASETEPVHLYQIWLMPERKGLTPSYEQKTIEKRPGWRLAAAPEGAGGVLTIRQDAYLHLADVGEGEKLSQEIRPGRFAWLQVLRGEIEVGGETLVAGDGAAFSDEAAVHLTGRGTSEVLLFDLA